MYANIKQHLTEELESIKEAGLFKSDASLQHHKMQLSKLIQEKKLSIFARIITWVYQITKR